MKSKTEYKPFSKVEVVVERYDNGNLYIGINKFISSEYDVKDFYEECFDHNKYYEYFDSREEAIQYINDSYKDWFARKGA